MLTTLLMAATALAPAAPAAPAAHDDSDDPIEPAAMLRLPRAVASFGAAPHDGDVYVFGGHVGRTHQHSAENLSPDFLRLDLDDGTLEELPGGTRLQGLALVACGDRIVRIGGLSARNPQGEDEDLHSTAEVRAWSTTDRAWSDLPSLPRPRSSHDAVVVGSKVYVAGGWDLSGETKAWADSVLVLDLDAPDAGWSELEQPFRRRALTVASDGARLFVIGGLSEEGRPARDVDVLDLASGAWTSGPRLPAKGFGASAWALDGRVHVALADGSVQRLEGDAWVAVAELAFGRMFPRLLPDGRGGLVVLGGAQAGGHVPWVERLAFDADGRRRTAVQVATLHHAGRSKQRFGSFVHKGWIYAFGGNTSTQAHRFKPENFLTESFRVHPASARYEARAPLPVARQSMSVATVGWPEVVPYALGGFGHDGEAERSQKDVLRYAVEDDAWTVAGALPKPLTQFGTALVDDRVYVFGGLEYDPKALEPFEHQDAIHVVDLGGATPTVEPAGTLPEPRRAFGGARLGDHYYVVGGMREDFQQLTTCWRYSFEDGSWTAIAAPARPRISSDLVALGGKLYLIGGSSSRDEKIQPDPAIEVYDPASDAWSTLVEEIPVSPKNLTATTWGEHLLLISAMSEEPELKLAFVTPGAPASRRAPEPRAVEAASAR